MTNIPSWARCAALAAILALLAGCDGKSDANKKADSGKKADTGKKADAAKKDEHDHPDKGPHGGVLAEWGDEKYHAEFTVDHKAKKATVYILDGTAKKAAPIPAKTITLSVTNVKPPLTLELKAEPQQGDPKDQFSRFSGTDDRLGVEMDFKGEISGKVGDTPYAGTFDEKGHDHKHDKK